MNKKKIEQELWRRGVLTWKLHEAQKKIDDTYTTTASKKLFVGEVARQFGKSYWAVTKCFEVALRKPKAKIKYATAFFSDLLSFIQPIADQILEDCPEDILPHWEASKSRFVFKNKSVIEFVGLDRKPNGLRGNNLTLAVIDEAGFVSKLHHIYTYVLVPATAHQKDARIIMISSSPDSPSHDFCSFADRAEIEGGYAKFTIHDNPRLTPEQVEALCKELGGPNSTAWKREALCIRVVESNRAIVPEWEDKYISEPEVTKLWPFYEHYEALDIGVKIDLTVCLFATYDFQKAKLFIQDEIWMNGPDMITPILADSIKAKETELWQTLPVQHRIADSSDPLLQQDLAILHNLPFMTTNKERLYEMVNLVRVWAGSGRIIVSPKCKQLLGCLRNGIWDERRIQFDRSKVFGHFDALAALVYLVRNIDEGYNPVPKHPFKTFDYFILPGDEGNYSRNAEALKKLYKLK